MTAGDRNEAYNWQQLHADGVDWEEWNPEAQAEAVQDYNDALQRINAGEGSAEDYQDPRRRRAVRGQDAQPRLRPRRARGRAGRRRRRLGQRAGHRQRGRGRGRGGRRHEGRPCAAAWCPARRGPRTGRAPAPRRPSQAPGPGAAHPGDHLGAHEQGRRGRLGERPAHDPLNFRVGRSQLKPEHIAALEQFFRANGVLYRNPLVTLDLSGHTSGSGPGTINASVSTARAGAVAGGPRGRATSRPRR